MTPVLPCDSHVCVCISRQIIGKLLFILLLLFYFGQNIPKKPPFKGSSAPPPVVDRVMTHVRFSLSVGWIICRKQQRHRPSEVLVPVDAVCSNVFTFVSNLLIWTLRLLECLTHPRHSLRRSLRRSFWGISHSPLIFKAPPRGSAPVLHPFHHFTS